jgi:hypothetical protein
MLVNQQKRDENEDKIEEMDDKQRGAGKPLHHIN